MTIAIVSNIIQNPKTKQISITIQCPYCYKQHSHGGGKNLNNIKEYYSHRLSHCSNGAYIIKQ